MLRRCLVHSGTFALGLAIAFGFALESRASTIRILDLPVRESHFEPTRHGLSLGLARLDLGRDDDWRRTSRDDDDDNSRGDQRSGRSRDDDDDDGDKGKGKGKGKGDKGKSNDDDDGKPWDHDDDGKSKDDDDDGKPRHDDDDGGKPKPHHDDDDEGGYTKPIPEPRAIIAFTIGALVVGWATRRARR